MQIEIINIELYIRSEHKFLPYKLSPYVVQKAALEDERKAIKECFDEDIDVFFTYKQLN